MRLRGAYKFGVTFLAWTIPLGYTSVYCDGWNNQINIGLICVYWMTPPMIGDA